MPAHSPGITWLDASQRWQLRIFAGKRTGRKLAFCDYFAVREYGSKTAARHAAEASREEKLGELRRGGVGALADPTVNQLLDEYLITKSHLQTIKELRRIAEHIRPALGDLTVRQVEDTDVTRLQVALLGHLAPKTVRHIMHCLRGALARAVVRGVVPFNPANAVKLPEVPPTAEIYNGCEVAALLCHADGTWLHPAVLLLADCAMRPGEICALRWDDLTLDGSALRVRRSRNNAKGTTKTPAGCRDLPLTARGRAGLGQWRMKCPSTAWIFPALNGAPKALCVQTFDEHFGRLLQRAGVRRRRAYDLRHTSITVAVTNAARSGKVNLQDVARWAGHKRVSTTLEIYTAAIADGAAMAEVMELGWGNVMPQPAPNDEAA